MHTVQRRHPRVVVHHQPATLDEALDRLAELGPRGRPVAGGTDLLLDLARGARPGVEELVDLTRIPGLAAITETEGRSPTVTLGALVTHNDVLADRRLARVALPLAQACLEVGAPALRNRATVVGNIVTASPANDTLSALIAMDAMLTVRSATTERTLPVADFVTGFRTVALSPGELVTAVHLPALGARRRGVFVKLGLRRAQAISVVHAAVVLSVDGDGAVVEPRVVLGSVAPTVVRVPEAEATLAGRPLDDTAVAAAAAAARSAARPIDDVRGTAAYRSETVEVVVRRALAALRDGTERAAWPARPALLHRPAQPPPSNWRARVAPGATVARQNDVIAVTVNGRTVERDDAAGRTLLDWLRSAGFTGAKEGCAEGECGACTVLMDGVAVLACLVPAARAAGTGVTTIEGLGPDGTTAAHPVARAFVTRGAVQCGFCTPGFVVAAAALLESCPAPEPDEVRRGLAGNLCRCTGYYTILDAVQEAAVSIERAGA